MQLTFRDQNGFVKLTEEGKQEALAAVRNGSVKSEEKDFADLLNFILKFYNLSIDEALSNGISSNDIRLDQISKSTENRKRLETWFEANILPCDKTIADFDYLENGLTGEEVVSYFSGKEFQNGIKEHGWTSTIKGMTDVIQRNSMLGNVELFEQMKTQPVIKTGRAK